MVRLQTDRLILTLPLPETAPKLVAFFTENRAHTARWDPPRADGFLTESYWADRLAENLSEFESDRSMRLALLMGDAVVGLCNFSQFVRGPFQACNLGFVIDHRREGQGLMTEALGAAIPYVFATLGLHRIMANYVPENTHSERLLARHGFVREGLAPNYLFINGAWRDHVLTALTNPNPKAPA